LGPKTVAYWCFRQLAGSPRHERDTARDPSLGFGAQRQVQVVQTTWISMLNPAAAAAAASTSATVVHTLASGEHLPSLR
jgi:hypothetical protein